MGEKYFVVFMRSTLRFVLFMGEKYFVVFMRSTLRFVLFMVS
jgi:hypothetical protein